MLKTKSFLCGDFGAGTLKLAEFEPNEEGSLRLQRFALRALGKEGSQESSRAETLLRALQDVIASEGFESRQINICAAGFNVFSKFVKLPPVDTAKVTQIIQYEAQQNVPFPLEDVVWDHQILGTTPEGELEVLLVAIKSEVVEGLFSTAESADLNLQLLDVSPAALCNAFRFNYGEPEGCTMLLDIGAKTSNLLFFEAGKVFSRSINIGANAITQDFASESRLAFDEAEQVKIEQGFVGLGGAYAEPDNPHQAQISKIARQVMTRLHIQMNQTIQFYRGQQGGSAPDRLFLAGGATLMPYTAQFFADKLNIEVDYFNPLANIELDEELNMEYLATVAHTLGETVGLAIRNLAQCPVELNLMPRSYVKREQLKQKRPYFIATVASMILVVFAYGFFFDRVAATKRAAFSKLDNMVQPIAATHGQLVSSMTGLKQGYDLADQYKNYFEQRTFWLRFSQNMKDLLVTYEAKTARTNSSDVAMAGMTAPAMAMPNMPATTTTPGMTPAPGMADGPTAFGIPRDTAVWLSDLELLKPATGAAANAGGAAVKQFGIQSGPVAPAIAGPITVHYLQAKFGAINLAGIAPDENTRFAFGLVQDLKTNAMFQAQGTELLETEPVDATATNFSFKVRLLLKKPLTLY